MTRKHTIAFIPTHAYGHIRSMIAIAQTLSDMGHKCVFIIADDHKEMFADVRQECLYYTLNNSAKTQMLLHSHNWPDLYRKSPLAQTSTLLPVIMGSLIERNINNNDEYERLITDVKPDAIVVDLFEYLPSVVCAGVPWITINSSNPLCIVSNDNLPPAWSGYGLNSDKKLWNEFRREKIRSINDIWIKYNEWLLSKGAIGLKNREFQFNASPYLNLYLYPEELDYKNEMSVKDKTFVSFDSMIGYNVENESKGFEIPENIRKGSGKLVYLSMGSIFSVEITLMKRFVSTLSTSKHRFIISKGQRGQEYELSDNMWGQNWLPQLQVLPIVDLVLTHGGNNTFNECLYFAKPMIVFPICFDQYDNAQRLVDKGLGVRLDPYECTQTELFEAMDSLLNDSELKAKYESISQRMKNSKSSQMCAKLIEDLITENKLKLFL